MARRQPGRGGGGWDGGGGGQPAPHDSDASLTQTLLHGARRISRCDVFPRPGQRHPGVRARGPWARQWACPPQGVRGPMGLWRCDAHSGGGGSMFTGAVKRNRSHVPTPDPVPAGLRSRAIRALLRRHVGAAARDPLRSLFARARLGRGLRHPPGRRSGVSRAPLGPPRSSEGRVWGTVPALPSLRRPPRSTRA